MMQQNSRRGGRPSRFAPSTLPGAGLLGNAPGPGGFPGGFNQTNTSILGQAPGSNNRGMQLPNFGAGQGAGLGAVQSLLGQMTGAKAGNQHMNNILRQQTSIMGNFMQQHQQQQKQQQSQMQQQQQQRQQPQPHLPAQALRDTQLNIVNSLLKRGMTTGQSGSMDNQMRSANSILGSPFPRPGMPMGSRMPGMKGNFRAQNLGQMPGVGRPPSAGLGLLSNPAIPSIFDLNTNPTNRIAQRKRTGLIDGEPDVKRYRKDSGQFPAGGTFNQNQARYFDRPDNRNDRHDNNMRRSAPRFAGGRRDSSSSSHSDRSQNSRWQPAQGGSSVRTRDEYDPAEPTDETDQSRRDSQERGSTGHKSPLGVDDGDGDFSVTVDKTGRSVSDKKEERRSKSKEKKSPFFCHSCNVECNSEENFTRHMQSEFHKKCLSDLLDLTQQKSSQLQARLKAEAHLRNIEENDTDDREGFCEICDEVYTGSLIRHRRTTTHKQRETGRRSRWGQTVRGGAGGQPHPADKSHTPVTTKMKDKMKWPRCSVCDQTFKSPLKYVKHLNTAQHKERKAQDKDCLDDGELEAEDWPEFLNPEDLVTLDAIGQSDEESDKSEEEYMDTNQPEEGETEIREGAPRPTHPQPYTLPPFDGVTVVGQRFVIPVSGFFCKLCHKFYNKETTARVTHCQSQAHYDKYQKLLLSKLDTRPKESDDLTHPVSQSAAEDSLSAQSAELASTDVQSMLQENGLKVAGNGASEFPDQDNCGSDLPEQGEGAWQDEPQLTEKDEERLLADEEKNDDSNTEDDAANTQGSPTRRRSRRSCTKKT